MAVVVRIDLSRYGAALARVASLAALVLAAVVLLTTLDFAYRSHFVGPYQDFWYFILSLQLLELGESAWRHWTDSFAGHRMLVPRIFYRLEYELFQGQNVFLAWAGLLLQATLVAIFAHVFSRGRLTLRRSTRRFLIGIWIALSFSSTQLVNVVVPWNVQIYLVSTSAALALFCLIEHVKLRRVEEGRRVRSRELLWLFLCVLLALVSTYSMANGLLVWPLLFGLGLLLGARRGTLAVILALSIPVLATYFDTSPTGAVVPRLNFGMSAMRFLVECVGAPVTWQHPRVGRAIGAIGVLLAVLALVRTVRARREIGASEALVAGLLGFAGGSLVLIALGRADLGPEFSVAPRYQTQTLLFWSCLISFWGIQLECRGGGSGVASTRTLAGRLVLFAAGLLFVVAGVLPEHFRRGEALAERAEHVRSNNVALLTGVQEIEEHRFIVPRFVRRGTPDLANALAPFLRSHGLGSFAPGHHQLLGRKRASALPATVEMGCTGGVERIARTAAKLDSAVRLQGTAHDIGRGASPTLLLFTEADDSIVGIGMPVERRSPMGSLRSSDASGTRWVGYVPEPPAGRVDVWAVLADEHTCPLARAVRLRPSGG